MTATATGYTAERGGGSYAFKGKRLARRFNYDAMAGKRRFNRQAAPLSC
jgi:hypothetical protein